MNTAPEERLNGYARVSATEQEQHLQLDALLAHGVEERNLFCDKLSGAREDRPGLTVSQDTWGEARLTPVEIDRFRPTGHPGWR